MKEEKVGLTPTNWILSIIGIILLSCVIILPPVFRTVFKEEEKEEEKPAPIYTTTCYKNGILGESFTDNITLTFKHQNSKISEVSKKTIRTYTDPILYQEVKTDYGRLVTAFINVNGYDYSANPNDDNSEFTINELYDLNTFRTTMIVIEGDTEPTEVKSSYQLNDSITLIKQELTNDGYTCE